MIVAVIALSVALTVALVGLGWLGWRRMEERYRLQAQDARDQAVDLAQQLQVSSGLLVALAYAKRPKSGEVVRIPKSALTATMSWGVTPTNRQDGGIDLRLAKREDAE